MAEYIERKALEEALNRRYSELTDECGPYDQYTDGYGDAIGAVENFPSAADVAPVVHAQWEETALVEVDTHGEIYRIPNAGLRCPWCMCVFDEKLLWRRSYCPNCGARMDGGTT